MRNESAALLANDAATRKQLLLDAWNGQLPDWDAFRRSAEESRVHAHVELALFFMKEASTRKWNVIYTGAFILRVISMFLLLATIIMAIFYSTGRAGGWWLITTLLGTWAAFKLSSKPFLGKIAMRAAKADQTLYETMRDHGVFMFEPNRQI